MRQSRKGALYLLLAAALLAGYFLNLEKSREQGNEEFPAVDRIRAQEQADGGEIEQELLKRAGGGGRKHPGDGFPGAGGEAHGQAESPKAPWSCRDCG